MKKLKVLFLVSLVLLFIVGCAHVDSGEYPWSLTLGENNRQIRKWDLHAYPVEGTLTPTELRYTFYNETDLVIYDGHDFILQMYYKHRWYDVGEPSSEWPAELLTYMPGESTEFLQQWGFLYGDLPAGKYRIVKDGWTDDGETVYITCEFEIN